MSKVPYTIDVNRYVCSELEEIRKMIKVLDFSGLEATVERVQHHVTAMEEALYRYEDIKYTLKKEVDNKEMSDKEFRKNTKKVLKKLKR